LLLARRQGGRELGPIAVLPVFHLDELLHKRPRAAIQIVLVGDKVMMPVDLKRLHKYMLEIEHIDEISDEMRVVVESEWPELAHKLPPRKPRG
jgi:hypothetical protein